MKERKREETYSWLKIKLKITNLNLQSLLPLSKFFSIVRINLILCELLIELFLWNNISLRTLFINKSIYSLLLRQSSTCLINYITDNIDQPLNWRQYIFYLFPNYASSEIYSQK